MRRRPLPASAPSAGILTKPTNIRQTPASSCTPTIGAGVRASITLGASTKAAATVAVAAGSHGELTPAQSNHYLRPPKLAASSFLRGPVQRFISAAAAGLQVAARRAVAGLLRAAVPGRAADLPAAGLPEEAHKHRAAAHRLRAVAVDRARRRWASSAGHKGQDDSLAGRHREARMTRARCRPARARSSQSQFG